MVGCGLTPGGVGGRGTLLDLLITNSQILSSQIFVHFLLLFSLMDFSPSHNSTIFSLETTSKSLPLAVPLSSTPHSHLCQDDPFATTMTFIKHFYISGTWLTFCLPYHLIFLELHKVSNITHFIDGELRRRQVKQLASNHNAVSTKPKPPGCFSAPP